jgi:hypothetical protein
VSLLNPTAALARAVAGVAAQGFAVVARNTRGDSVYLKPEGERLRAARLEPCANPEAAGEPPGFSGEPRHPAAEDGGSSRCPGGGGLAELRGRVPQAGGLKPHGFDPAPCTIAPSHLMPNLPERSYRTAIAPSKIGFYCY